MKDNCKEIKELPDLALILIGLSKEYMSNHPEDLVVKCDGDIYSLEVISNSWDQDFTLTITRY